METLMVIVVLLAIMAAIVGGTWYWLEKAVKEKPSDLPVIGDKSWDKADAERRSKVVLATGHTMQLETGPSEEVDKGRIPA